MCASTSSRSSKTTLATTSTGPRRCSARWWRPAAWAERAAAWDRTRHFPRDVIDEMGKLGFLGMCAPEEYDGMGLDALTYLMVLEEIAAADAALAVSVGIHNAIPTTMLVKHGTPEQRERWLKPMARGELL